MRMPCLQAWESYSSGTLPSMHQLDSLVRARPPPTPSARCPHYAHAVQLPSVRCRACAPRACESQVRNVSDPSVAVTVDLGEAMDDCGTAFSQMWSGLRTRGDATVRSTCQRVGCKVPPATCIGI